MHSELLFNNWRRHREDSDRETRGWNVDPFSTGVLFWGWKECEGAEALWRWRPTYEPLVVYLPRTLLQKGWRKGGPLIRFHEVPGPRVA